MNARDIPNIITGFRILLVFPVVMLLSQYQFAAALAIFVLAGVSDGVDGFLARRYHWHSRLGSILDPLADKLLISAVLITLAWLAIAPWWLVLAVFCRDLIIVVGAAACHYILGEYSVEPSLLSKLNTFLQLIVILALMVEQIWHDLPQSITTWSINLMMLTTILSGLSYIVVWSLRVLRGRKPG